MLWLLLHLLEKWCWSLRSLRWILLMLIISKLLLWLLKMSMILITMHISIRRIFPHRSISIYKHHRILHALVKFCFRSVSWDWMHLLSLGNNRTRQFFGWKHWVCPFLWCGRSIHILNMWLLKVHEWSTRCISHWWFHWSRIIHCNSIRMPMISHHLWRILHLWLMHLILHIKVHLS